MGGRWALLTIFEGREGGSLLVEDKGGKGGERT